MIESAAVGAVFSIEDMVTPALAKINASFKEADELITKFEGSLGRINSLMSTTGKKAGAMSDLFRTAFSEMDKTATATSSGVVGSITKMNSDLTKQFDVLRGNSADLFTGMGTSADAGVASVVGALGKADTAIETTMGRITAMKAELDALGTGMSVATALPALPGVAGGGTRAPGSGGYGRAGHGRNSVHFGRVGGEVAGVHASVAGSAGMALGLAALDGLWQAGEIDDAVARALATSQIPIGPGVSNTDAGKRISDIIKNSSVSTGLSFKESGEAVLAGQRLLSNLPFNERNDVIGTIMPFAGSEGMLKGGSTLEQAFEAIVGIAHQTQTYDAAGIQKIAKDLAFTSMLTPATLPQFKNTLGYSVPELYNGLGMDPSTLMLLTATMQQSGIGSTKAGTWLRSFFENSEPGTKKHNAALQKLGMLDADDNITWRVKGADGKIDWNASVGKLSTILQRDQQDIPIDERIGLLRQAYGERGAGFASLMMGKKFTENLTANEANMATFKGGDDFLSQYGSASILQQSRQTYQQFNVAMAELGTQLMPVATRTLREFNDLLKTDDPIGKLATDFRNWLKGDGANAFDRSFGGKNLPNMEDRWKSMQGGLLHREAFTTGDDALADSICSGFLKAFNLIKNGGVDAGGSGGGIINAAYETWDGAGSSALPNLRYGRRGGGSYRSTPGSGNLIDGPISRFGNFKTFDQKAPEVMRRLMSDFGIDAPGAAKILGNLGHESRGFQDFAEKGGGSGIGWAQWTGSRHREFLAWAAANHLDPKSDEANYGMLRHDLQGRYAGVISMIKRGASLEAVEQAYEAAGIKAYGSRHAYEQRALRAFRASPALPTVGAPPPAAAPHVIHTEVKLDGRTLVRSVQRSQIMSHMIPGAVGRMNTRLAFASPGTPLDDCA